jgi:hypothetical protein
MPSCMRQPCSGFQGRANRSSTPMWMAPAGFWYRPRARGRGFSFTSVRQASSWMMPVRPFAMPMSAHRHFRTTSRLTWQARHGLNRSYWRPTSRPSAPSLFARRHSGGPATRSAGRCPRQRKDGDPPISRSMMRMIGREFSVNDASARRELGYVGRTSRAMGLRSYAQPSRQN